MGCFGFLQKNEEVVLCIFISLSLVFHTFTCELFSYQPKYGHGCVKGFLLLSAFLCFCWHLGMGPCAHFWKGKVQTITNYCITPPADCRERTSTWKRKTYHIGQNTSCVRTNTVPQVQMRGYDLPIQNECFKRNANSISFSRRLHEYIFCLMQMHLVRFYGLFLAPNILKIWTNSWEYVSVI